MLDGKHIVVTGAGRGIGRAIAISAASSGAMVGLNYRPGSAGIEQTASAVMDAGRRPPILLEFDATESEAIRAGIERFLKSAPRIDGWVNNAAENHSGLLPVLEEEEIQLQLDSAILGPILCCRAIIPRLLEQRGGSIVNIGSAVTRRFTRGQSVYAAAKGGLLAFSRALACEYGRKGIRVNCVQPGPVDTGMLEPTRILADDGIRRRIPLGRLVTPEEVARAVVFLLSDLSAGITGACLDVDGGFSWNG